jgi:hypothetical protein
MAAKAAAKQGAWKHSRRAAWRKVADEAVILDVKTAVYYSLSGAGRRMWELLGRGRTAAEIGKALAAEYDADERDIRQDCAALIGRLLKAGLLERA